MVSQSEAEKTTMSNRGISSFGKSSKDFEDHGKSNQKAKEVVRNQREGAGPSKSSGLFDFGVGPGFLSENGPNHIPFCFFSLASLCPNPIVKKKSSWKSTPMERRDKWAIC